MARNLVFRGRRSLPSVEMTAGVGRDDRGEKAVESRKVETAGEKKQSSRIEGKR